MWLGVREGAGEYVIGTLEGVVKVRTEKERIARRKMDLEGIQRVQRIILGTNSRKTRN